MTRSEENSWWIDSDRTPAVLLHIPGSNHRVTGIEQEVTMRRAKGTPVKRQGGETRQRT